MGRGGKWEGGAVCKEGGGWVEEVEGGVGGGIEVRGWGREGGGKGVYYSCLGWGAATAPAPAQWSHNWQVYSPSSSLPPPLPPY